MRKLLAEVAAAAVAAGVAVLAGGLSASAAVGGQTVQVSGSSAGLHFSTTHVPEGNISFQISTTNSAGSGLVLFRLKPGVSFAMLDADLREEFGSAPAKGTRDLVRDVTIYGGADVEMGTPVTATINLEEKVYYAFDFNSSGLPTAQTVTRFVVGEGIEQAAAQGSGWNHSASVSLTSSDRFQVRGELHASGSILVQNVADTIHFMDLIPVKAGTTDAQVQAFFDSGAHTRPPFARNGPSFTMEVLSPGRDLVLHYSLPRGSYVLACFIADDVTGMPHAFMGMHKVITLH